MNFWETCPNFRKNLWILTHRIPLISRIYQRSVWRHILKRNLTLHHIWALCSSSTYLPHNYTNSSSYNSIYRSLFVTKSRSKIIFKLRVIQTLRLNYLFIYLLLKWKVFFPSFYQFTCKLFFMFALFFIHIILGYFPDENVGYVFYKLKAADPDISSPDSLVYAISEPITATDKDGRQLPTQVTGYKVILSENNV